MKKYEVIVTAIGEMVEEFYEMGMAIIFDDNAPPELKEISIAHTRGNLLEDVVPGDVFMIDGKAYTVTAVGEEANKTLVSMGHCTLKFEGNSEAELPGHIELLGEEPFKFEIGTKIIINKSLI